MTQESTSNASPSNNDDLPGMWEASDFFGGEADGFTRERITPFLTNERVWHNGKQGTVIDRVNRVQSGWAGDIYWVALKLDNGERYVTDARYVHKTWCPGDENCYCKTLPPRK